MFILYFFIEVEIEIMIFFYFNGNFNFNFKKREYEWYSFFDVNCLVYFCKLLLIGILFFIIR